MNGARLIRCLLGFGAFVALVAACERFVTGPDQQPPLKNAPLQATPAPGPASITQTLLAAGNSMANQKAYTTAAISPAPNALITVAVLGHRSTNGVDLPLGAPPSPTVSGGGMTAWTQVATITADSLARPLKRLTIYRALSATPGSGPLTITFSNNVSNAQWIVSQWA